MEQTGIIGCGDLGRPLADRAIKSGLHPVIYDKESLAIQEYRDTFDFTETVGNEPFTDAFTVCDNLEDLARIKGIVNFAVPASALETFPALGDSQLGIMHDSVMSSSYSAIQQRAHVDRHMYSIVHLLMNRHDRAILDPEYGNVQKVEDYLQRLGLNVLMMGYEEHDQMMAKSQGAMLELMVRYGHKLRLLQAAHYLEERPVLQDLNDSLLARNAQWTDATIMSIMRNPHVKLDYDEVRLFIERKHRIKVRGPQALTASFLTELLETEASVEEADGIEEEFTKFAHENLGTLAVMNEEGLLTPSSEELHELVARNVVLAA